MDTLPQADIYLLLEAQYELVEQLFDHLETAAAFPAGLRRQLITLLRDQLENQLSAEEATFYASLAPHKSRDELLQRAQLEHEHIRRLLCEMTAMSSAGAGWNDKLKELRYIVEAHFVEEETELFEIARSLLSAREARELARKMQAAMTGTRPATRL